MKNKKAFYVEALGVKIYPAEKMIDVTEPLSCNSLYNLLRRAWMQNDSLIKWPYPCYIIDHYAYEFQSNWKLSKTSAVNLRKGKWRYQTSYEVDNGKDATPRIGIGNYHTFWFYAADSAEILLEIEKKLRLVDGIEEPLPSIDFNQIVFENGAEIWE